MKAKWLTVVCLLLAGPVCSVADNKPPVLPMTDYAWGFPVQALSDASFYTLELPLEFNQSVADPQLRDAGVYNAAGQPVPRVFARIRNETDQTEHQQPMPAMAVYASDQSDGEDMKLLFERDGDKARVEFSAQRLQPPPAGQRVTAYLVDTRTLKPSIEALEFAWNDVATGFIGRIMVDGSNNLENWSELGAGAVADLRQEEAAVVQRRVKLRETSHDYLRIRWQGMPDDWSLAGIEAFYSTGTSKEVRHTVTLDAASSDEGRIFELAGAPLVDRLQLELTQPNTIIQATIDVWLPIANRWQRVAAGSHHLLGRGNNIIASSAIHLAPQRVSRVKVVVTRGQAMTPMRLKVGWRPDTVTFLAQGAPPFTLVAGRAADALAQFPLDQHYNDRSIIGLARNGRAVEATLGPRYALAGSGVLDAGKPVQWRLIILWIGLIVGVALVGFMAFRVVRDLKAQ